MRKKRLKSISTLALALAVFSPQIQSFVNPNFNVNASPKESDQQTIGKFDSKGLMGYYFEDDNFKNPVKIGPDRLEVSKVKNVKNAKIKSAKFCGNIKPIVSGDHKFKTTVNENVEIKVNGKTVMKDKNISSIKLEKDKLYNIEITYKPIGNAYSLADLGLSYSIDDKNFKEIPNEMLLLSNLSNDTNALTELTDTDHDSIPNQWEKDGYTVDDYLEIVPWDESYQGIYPKYTSNLNKAHTAGDPYSDSQKVLGQMPAATAIEARDPMVAAYPAVNVGMEKLLFSKNENVSEGQEGTKSTSTTSSQSNTDSLTAGGEIGGGFSWKISGNYGHSWTSGTSVQDTSSESWSNSIGMNTADAAYLNANVRYYNAGNAPIYNAKPTVSFGLRNAEETLLTVESKPDNIASGLAPSATYPSRDQLPMALTQLTTNGVRMTVDKPTLDKIQTNAETVELITNQTTGSYGVLGSNGENLIGGEWGPILTDINAVSASIILAKPGLNAESGNVERRVAVKDYDDKLDKTPEITIGEAIKKAFNAKEGPNGMLYYKDSVTNKNIYLHESAVNIITDQFTSDEIQNQINAGATSIYDCKLKRNMNITLNAPSNYFSFESGTENWSNITSVTDQALIGDKCAKPSSTTASSGDLDLEEYTTYKLCAMVRPAVSKSSSIKMGMLSSTGGETGSKTFNFDANTNNSWKSIEFEFTTDGTPEKFKKIFLNSADLKSMLFDEVQLSKLDRTEKPLAPEDFESVKKWDWTVDRETQGSDYYGIDSVTIPVNFTDNKYNYKVIQNGSDLGTKAMPAPSNKKVTIGLDSYNGGKGLNVQTGDIQIIAVDKSTKEEKLIGMWEKNKKSFEHISWNRPTSYVDGQTAYYPVENPDNFKYKVYVNGNQLSTELDGKINYNDGTVYIEFLKYNGGYGIDSESHIQVYAVDMSSDIKDEYLIGEWRE